MPNDMIIEASGLTKQFAERVAVDNVTLAVPRGCAFGFLGHNGAGKTTTIRMLLGLTRADSGTMRLRGLAVPAEREQALARIGAIVEEPHFHPHLSGRESLRVAAAVRGTATFARIEGALGRVGLSDRADEKVSRYSQGMRQRLGVARCLIADPELLILDEPTNGLDPAGIIEFRQMIRALVGEGRTVFLSSHLLGEVEKACDAVAIIDAGRIVKVGPIAELTHGAQAKLVVECSHPQRAAQVLATQDSVLQLDPDDGALVLTLSDPSAGASLNRLLVEAGIDVKRLEPVRNTLEERFLELTSRLEAVA